MKIKSYPLCHFCKNLQNSILNPAAFYYGAAESGSGAYDSAGGLFFTASIVQLHSATVHLCVALKIIPAHRTCEKLPALIKRCIMYSVIDN